MTTVRERKTLAALRAEMWMAGSKRAHERPRSAGCAPISPTVRYPSPLLSLTPDGLPVRALPLDWAHAALPASERPAAWRQVLAPVDRQRRDLVAADVIYDPDIVPLLVNAIRVLLTENVQEDQERPVAVLAATVRNEQTFKLFLDTCGKLHLNLVCVPS
jgi:hypothetical protein